MKYDAGRIEAVDCRALAEIEHTHLKRIRVRRETHLAAERMISRTRSPFDVPPIDGLHGILPTQSRLTVNTSVLHPRRAEASPASIPA